jgi:hypothetical protein
VTNVTANLIFDIANATNITSTAIVTLLRNGAPVASQSNVTGGTATLTDPGPLLSGHQYSYTVQQTDAAGNTSQPSSAVLVTIDASTPATLGLTLDPSTVTSTVPQIDISGVVAGDAVDLYRDGTPVASLSNVGGGSTTLSDSVPGGTHHYVYTVQQSDSAGDTSPASGGLAVTIDTSAPPALGLSLDRTSIARRQRKTVLSYNTPEVDISGIVDGAVVTITRGGTPVGPLVSTGNGNATFTDSLLRAGKYTYSVTETNAAGNTSTATSLLVNVSKIRRPHPRKPKVQHPFPSLRHFTPHA